MSARTPRVAVIGSGPNGLVCAALLAARGLDVTVLERSARPGGGIASAEATLPGFVHDLCAGFFPLAVASPVLRGLELDVDWISPPVPMAHPFEDGRALCLHRSLEATVAGLDSLAPGAGEGWRAVAGPLLAHRELLLRTALSPLPPPPGAALRLASRLGRDGLELARLLLGSSDAFGRAVLCHEEATAWLSGSTAHSDLDPAASGGAAFGVLLHLLGHMVGWPLPRGGAGRLVDALLGRIEGAGGRVRCGAEVERVDCRGGRVRAVRLAGGEELPAEAAVAAVSVRPFLSMVGPGALPWRLERRLRRWRYGIGTFKLDHALEGPVPWASEDARRAAVVHIGDTLERQLAAFHEARLGRVPEEPTMVVGQQSLHDPSRAPRGAHTLYLYARVPQRLDVPEDEVVDRIERRIERLAPGFRELVLARAARSPERLERENPNLVGGDLAGGSLELDQELVFRPHPRLLRYRTPVRGLYLAGSSVHPGAGVHGVCGAGAARAVIADRRLRRLRP